MLKVLKLVSDFTIISQIFDNCVDPGGILISKHLIKMKKVQCALFGLPIPWKWTKRLLWFEIWVARLKGIQVHNFWLANFSLSTYFLQLMSVGLAWKLAAKSNERLVNQKYATLFLSWMLFRIWQEHLWIIEGKTQVEYLASFLINVINLHSMLKHSFSIKTHFLLFYKTKLSDNQGFELLIQVWLKRT